MTASEQTEIRFELRKSFAQYGAPALKMMLHVGVLSDDEFFERYQITKDIVKQKLVQLEIAEEHQDFVGRNECYDFFLEVL